MVNVINNKINNFENRVKLFEHTILKLNPNNLLVRGYTKLEVNGIPVMTVNEVNAGDNVTVRLIDGKITAQVSKVDKEKK